MNKKMLNSKLLSLMLAGASLPLGALAQGLTVSGMCKTLRANQ